MYGWEQHDSNRDKRHGKYLDVRNVDRGLCFVSDLFNVRERKTMNDTTARAAKARDTLERTKHARIARLRERAKQAGFREPHNRETLMVILGMLDLLGDEL